MSKRVNGMMVNVKSEGKSSISSQKQNKTKKTVVQVHRFLQAKLDQG